MSYLEMSTTPKDCPACGLTNPSIATRCDCGHNFDRPLPPRGNKPERAGRLAERPQGYAFGWCIACGSLAMGTNSLLLALQGFPLAAGSASWQLAVGLAAVVVKPWSWHVLLASQVLFPMWGGYYMAFVARDWMNRAFVAFSITSSVIPFAYFYKRRAMFGARGRWQRLERWFPRLIGPQTHDTGNLPGFAGLTHRRRLFFGAILAALILLETVDGVVKPLLGVIILLALFLFVRRVREPD